MQTTKTKLKEHNEILIRVEELLKSLDKPELRMIPYGLETLNFILYDGKSEEQMADGDIDITLGIRSADEREQLKKAENTCETFNSVRVNHKPKRDNNTTDFLYTINMALFMYIEVNIKKIWVIIL